MKRGCSCSAARFYLAFSSAAVLEPGFDRLPPHAQYVKLVALAATLVVTCLLVWPATFHQITEAGEDTEDVHEFTTRAVCWALLAVRAGVRP